MTTPEEMTSAADAARGAETNLRDRVAVILGPGCPDALAVLARAGWVEESARDDGWDAMPLAGLCEHIIERHHGYLRDVLPRLSERAATAAGRDPAYRVLADLFAGFRMDLEAHMAKEEGTFFPQMAALEQAGTSSSGMRPSVAGPIGFLEAEHEEALASLARMERLTDGFTPPEGADTGIRLLLAELTTLAEDMRWHVYKEDEVLFPRAAALERAATPEVW